MDLNLARGSRAGHHATVLTRRWILLAATAAVGLGAFLWLRTARPDGRFQVLGDSVRLEPVAVGEAWIHGDSGIVPGQAISNAFDTGEEPAARAGRYEWRSTTVASSGEPVSRTARFQEGPWSDVDKLLVEREVHDGLGSTVARYRVRVRGAISADGLQWLFEPELTGSGRGRESNTLGEFRFDPLARRLELDLVEKLGGAPARRYRLSFVVGLDGTVRRSDG